ncbi:MAG: hypothetical protein COX17_08805 [Deltaproteobacteria bacterium CG23_combo_of_CG06-09_8_20_14_all_60_8]|nr:MAG: hypothetical protein COX17_08805 [Deltaproteobacteria bacterium CG23_combo_of_CG06-09_8_20_14_all_60_8]
MTRKDAIAVALQELTAVSFGPLDLLPREGLAEKLIDLDLNGLPAGPDSLTAGLAELAGQLAAMDTRDLEVVVFGGGTGLANVVGGDCRHPGWPRDPFQGMKALFPRMRSIVCVTDDGGSTGELMKDFPLIALGDLRHVLLSSVQDAKLRSQYGLDGAQSLAVAQVLHRLFNFRFSLPPAGVANLLADAGVDLAGLPPAMAEGLGTLLDSLFVDRRFAVSLRRPHCLGNLLLAAAIYREVADGLVVKPGALIRGLTRLADLVGAQPEAVLPCASTPANLKALYANGVLVTGEYRSSSARRGFPIDQVFIEFADEPCVPDEVLAAIARARIIVFAPGSLFTSIIPILQVPGLAEAVRQNRTALKILVTNLWIQKGETDLVHDDPRRRYHVSDLVKSYHRNIPGGVPGLFDAMLVLSLKDIPGSVLQGYALEDKVPIFLDKERVRQMGCNPVEARIFSSAALRERGVIQHDPAALARAIRTIWAVKDYLPEAKPAKLPVGKGRQRAVVRADRCTADQRLRRFKERLDGLAMDGAVRVAVLDILWRYGDIRENHLDFLAGVELVAVATWPRSQEWDNIFSFYDPASRCIKIREDVFQRPYRFELSFLVGLGESLLGDYAAIKEVLPVAEEGERLGSMYRLTVRPAGERRCFLMDHDLECYLNLARMRRATGNPRVFSRLINNDEGFTPPGLFFGLLYAWYLDNRFSTHIEYKMAIFKMQASAIIPYHAKTFHRRRAIIDFFRKVVFGHGDPAYDEKIDQSD